MKKLKIVFTGGGTWGHLMPIIAIGRELKKMHPGDDLVLHYIGPNDREGLALLTSEHFTVHLIVSGKLRRYFSLSNVTDVLFKIPFGFLQSFFLLLFLRPRLVFSKGGSGSAMVCVAARLWWIPVFLHESDVVPGLSNQIVSGWAKKVFTSFPKTEYFDPAKVTIVGNPIRRELLNGDETASKEALKITSERPVLLFLGGSQGAETINDLILLIPNELLQRYEVIHSSGSKNYHRVLAESAAIINRDLETYYHLYGSLGELELSAALKVASFVVSRAGSGSIFEIAAAGKPSILIPLSSAAGDHQSKNAYQYASTHSALVFEQGNLTSGFFVGTLNNLFTEPQKLATMSQAALQFSKPLAGQEIAKEMLNYLHAY